MIVSRVPRVGHALREIAVPLLYLFLWDVIVTVIYFKLTPHIRPIELQFSLFGSALALFIGVSVNAAYARWWEARGLWGREMARAQIAYVNVLRTALRGQPTAPEVARYLAPEWAASLDTMVNKQNAILTDIGRLASEAHRLGMLDPYARVRIDSTLVDIANSQGGMERIKNTPLPSQYRFFPAFFAKVFCVILPFAVVQDLGFYTPVGSALVGLMFLMAVEIGLDLMDPFADSIYDVPMTSMCRTVEIDLLQMMGEPAPEKIKPVDNVLW